MMVAADFEDENSDRMIDGVNAEILMVWTYKNEWVIISNGRILRLGVLMVYRLCITTSRYIRLHAICPSISTHKIIEACHLSEIQRFTFDC